MNSQTNGLLAPGNLIPDVAEAAAPQAVLQSCIQGKSTLRLLIPEGAVNLLQEAPVIVQNARNRGVVRRLDSIYYDTEDRLLFGKGMSLRVQKHGRRFMQTLKQHGGNPLMSQGVAWQAEVAGVAPDLSRLTDSDLDDRQALFERLAAAPLVPMFETRLRRQIRRLEISGAVVDVALDEGVIEAEHRQEALTEIRLALQDGDLNVIYDIGMRLLELAPLRVGSARSTVRRGYALASGVAQKAEKAAPSSIARGFAVDDMVAAVVMACQSHLQANQAVAERGDSPDGVHQMRVALRRMRSAFSLLRREMPSKTMEALSAEAKWAGDQLAAARAWDVFLSTTLSHPARHQTAATDFAGLRAAAEVPRAAGYAAVRALLKDPRFGRFQLSLSRWIARRGWRNEVDLGGLTVLAEPGLALAVRVLSRLHRKALKQGAHFKRLSAEDRHELRITLKKLRYAAEFFLPLFADPAQGRRFIARLTGLQDALGLDHDAAVTQPLLDELAQASRAPGVHQAIGLVIGWQARDCVAASETLVKNWREFKDLPPFWSKAAVPAHA